jgi:hypothetical protein
LEIYVKRHRLTLAAAALLFVSAALALAQENQSSGSRPFGEAAIYFEQNATDGDVEVVIEATGGKTGLAALRVVAPDGRAVVDLKAPDSKLGLRQFRFESPEPKDEGQVQADLPEGEYSFSGTTVTGVRLRGTATLSHKLPDTASFIEPAADAEDVPVKGLRVTWRPVKGLAAYIVVVEQEETGLEITARLPPSATSFAVPDGFLAPDTEYKLAIGTVSADGNLSFVEIGCTTAGDE